MPTRVKRTYDEDFPLKYIDTNWYTTLPPSEPTDPYAVLDSTISVTTLPPLGGVRKKAKVKRKRVKVARTTRSTTIATTTVSSAKESSLNSLDPIHDIPTFESTSSDFTLNEGCGCASGCGCKS